MKDLFVERIQRPEAKAAVVEEPFVTPKKIRPRQATALGHALLASRRHWAVMPVRSGLRGASTRGPRRG